MNSISEGRADSSHVLSMKALALSGQYDFAYISLKILN
jgi:hypothetical protein